MNKSQKKRGLILLIVISLLITGIVGYNLINRKRITTITHNETSISEERDLDIVFGSSNAEVTIVAYFSYSCTFCKKFFTDVYHSLNDEFLVPGKAKLIIRLMGNTGNISLDNALKTAVCVNKHGNYEYLHELFLHDFGAVFTDEFQSMIDEFIEKDIVFAECLLGGDAEEYLAKNAKDFEMLKLRGTPTFIIGSTIYPGYRDFEAFKAIINNEIVKQTTN
ncbi:MAG: DsbA family protein [Tenuifilaceae bacterium]|nr:DsbA family protein [Tenuifilaceae bacterium]